MAQTTVAINLEAKTKGTESVKSLKAQIREATQEATALAQKFGEFSPQAINAAKRVAQLKDEMQDFQEMVQALNPDKFEAIGKLVGGVASGIQAAQGAMALFGAESEDTQKALLKVQGAMAFAQGIQGILELRSAFTLLFTNVVAGFKTMAASITATGVGALIVGIGIAIGGLINYLNEQSEAEKKAAENAARLANELDDLNNSYSEVISQVDSYKQTVIAQMELEGKSESELFKTKKNFAEQKIALLKQQRDETDKNYVQQLKNLRNEGLSQEEYDKKFQEIKRKQLDTYKKFNGDIGKAGDELTMLEIENLKKIDEARKKAAELQKQLQSNELKSLQDLAEEKRKQLELNAKDERNLAEIKYKNDLDRLKVAKNNDLNQENLTAVARQAIINKYAIAAQNTKIEFDKKIIEIDKKTQDERLKQQEDFENKRKDLIEKEFADTVTSTDEFYKSQQIKLTERNSSANEFSVLELQRLQNQLQNAKDYGKSTVDLELQIAQKKKEIYDKDVKAKEDAEKAKQEAQIATLNEAANAISALGGILKDGSNAAKSAALLDIAIKTGVGFAQGLDIAQKGAAGTGPAAPYAFPIFYAQQIAAVLGAVSRAKAILKGGSGGGGSTGGGGVSVPSAPALAPTAGGTLPDEQQFGGMGRVYVLEGDITKTQTRVRRLRNTSVV